MPASAQREQHPGGERHEQANRSDRPVGSSGERRRRGGHDGHEDSAIAEQQRHTEHHPRPRAHGPSTTGPRPRRPAPLRWPQVPRTAHPATCRPTRRPGARRAPVPPDGQRPRPRGTDGHERGGHCRCPTGDGHRGQPAATGQANPIKQPGQHHRTGRMPLHVDGVVAQPLRETAQELTDVVDPGRERLILVARRERRRQPRPAVGGPQRHGPRRGRQGGERRQQPPPDRARPCPARTSRPSRRTGSRATTPRPGASPSVHRAAPPAGRHRCRRRPRSPRPGPPPRRPPTPPLPTTGCVHRHR